MSVDFLSCTVRGCGEPLALEGPAWRCARGHSFDIARSGYVNLLQPQDRRSSNAGDSSEAVDARSRVLAAGVGGEILQAFVEQAARILGEQSVHIIDLGCGSGELLQRLVSHRRKAVPAAVTAAVGIDLSLPAIERAARASGDITWVVANADRRLPIRDHSVDLVLSFNGRRNPDECARVLTDGGAVLVAVPGEDDLIELRALVQGEATPRDRTESLAAEFAPWFTVGQRLAVREQHRLSADALRDLLRGTYRGERESVASKVSALEAGRVTLATEILRFQRS